MVEVSPDSMPSASESMRTSHLSTFGLRCVVKNTFLQFDEGPDEDTWQMKGSPSTRSASVPKKLSGFALSGPSPRSLDSDTLSNYTGASACTPRAASEELSTAESSNIETASSTRLHSLPLYSFEHLGHQGDDELDDSCSIDFVPSSGDEFRSSVPVQSAIGVNGARRSSKSSPVSAWTTAPQREIDSAVDRGQRKSSKIAETAELHSKGHCKPCLYLNTLSGCLNGADCQFCHLPHQTRKHRPRPCKAKRMQCKQMVGMLQATFGEDSEQFQAASARLSTRSSYMRSLLQSHPDTGASRSPWQPCGSLEAQISL